jgi:hypothetical protein
MRSSICTAVVVAYVSLLTGVMAVPTFTASDGVGQTMDAVATVTAEPLDEEAMKYFHEPGYVAVIRTCLSSD